MIIYDGSGNEISLNDETGYDACEKIVYSADVINVSYYKRILHEFTPGHYAIKIDEVTSNDIDADTCYWYLNPGTNNIARYPDEYQFQLQRGENIYMEFDVFWEADSMIFCCSSDLVKSQGDTATFENVTIIKYDNSELGKYPFWGKKFAFIGDSYTETSKSWHRKMCHELHAINHRMTATSGARWTHNNEKNIPCAYEQAQQIVQSGGTPDYIYVLLGVNDFGNYIDIGQLVLSRNIADFDLQTVCGGIQACLNYLQNNYPDAVIRTGYTPNGKYYQLRDCTPYVNAIKEISEWYSVQYMDVITCGVSTLAASYDDGWEAPGNIQGGHPRQKTHDRIGIAMARKTLHGD